MCQGTIFDIQPFSVYDGPGIRTTVFLKGCNLRCKWCHNPESWEMQPQLRFYPEKCMQCGACFQLCPSGAHRQAGNEHLLQRDACNACGICAETCYCGALQISGTQMTANNVFQRILADREYFSRSKGGVTFSGGEPLLQPVFLKALLAACKKAGIHTAVDTAGCVPYSHFEQLLPVTDLFLFDIKAADTRVHQLLTGAPNELILENLEKLTQAGKRVIVRIPCIKGANLDEMQGIAAKLAGLPVSRVELLAYHKLGESKMEALGMAGHSFEVPAKHELEQIRQIFEKLNIPVIDKE